MQKGKARNETKEKTITKCNNLGIQDVAQVRDHDALSECDE